LLSRRLGILHDRPHRALSDARATGDLFRVLVGAGRNLPEATVAEMRRVAAQAPGPLHAFLSDVMVRPGVDTQAPVDHEAPPAAPPRPSSTIRATSAPDGRS